MVIKLTIAFLLFLHSSYADTLKKGEKIYSIMCDKEKVSTLLHNHKDSLKQEIQKQKVCGSLSDKNLDALLLFLKSDTKTQKKSSLIVPPDSRCPVCGMFTAKYPKWSALMQMEDGTKHYFDGVKDMMKFYFSPTQFHHQKAPIKEIFVTDYYTLEALDAKKAFYVIGSNIYGPMGEELIPFKTKVDAQNFLDEHHGKKILTFDTIKESYLY